MSSVRETNENNGNSTNNVSDNGSMSCGTNGTNIGASTPVITPEPKSASIPSGSRSEIHYPGVQNPSRIYDSKRNRKIVRIMTVMAYMFAVSLAAIVLSLYYVFLWDPNMQIHNSTHSKTITFTEVPLPTTTNINSNLNQLQNQLQNHILTNDKPMASSAQVLNLSTNRTNRTEPTMTTMTSSRPTTKTNVKSETYSANVGANVLSDVYRERDSVLKLVSKTNSANASSAVDTDKSIRKKKNKTETIAPETLPQTVPSVTTTPETKTSLLKFSETNPTHLNNESVAQINANDTRNETLTPTDNNEEIG